jgi:CrcB protein
MITLLLVALGGAIGAPARYFVERAVQPTQESKSVGVGMPWGVFIVNLLGSALAGIASAATDGPLRTFLLVGICGSFTTFSGFAWQALRCWRSDRTRFAIVVAGITGGSILAFWIGWTITLRLG